VDNTTLTRLLRLEGEAYARIALGAEYEARYLADGMDPVEAIHAASRAAAIHVARHVAKLAGA